jgi:site-specific DNA-methyltransferase (adenine-specific)
MAGKLPENQIICGDCLEVMKDWPDNCVDLVLTDPPYGTTACKWDTIIPLEPMWKLLKRLTKPDGAIVMTASQPFTTTLIASNIKMFKYEWIFDKKRITNPLNAKGQPLKQHENIVVFYSKQPTYNPVPYEKSTKGLLSKKNFDRGHSPDAMVCNNLLTSANENRYGYPRSIITQIPVMNNLGKDKTGLHPTQKPIALMEYLIKTYTSATSLLNENELVLDFACGSGTTCKAAQNLNRRYIGIDISEEYCQIARQRLEAVETGVPVKEQNQGQMALFNKD